MRYALLHCALVASLAALVLYPYLSAVFHFARLLVALG